jgi:hypothetical protein
MVSCLAAMARSQAMAEAVAEASPRGTSYP